MPGKSIRIDQIKRYMPGKSVRNSSAMFLQLIITFN